MTYTTAQSRVQMKWLALFFGVVCLAIAAGARAEGGGRPCKDDADKLCQGIKPGGGAIMRCLKQHESELSPECKERMQQAKAKAKQSRQEFKEACGGDVQRQCPGMKPGGGAIMACLKAHENQLSDSCKEQMGKMKNRRGPQADQSGGDDDNQDDGDDNNNG